VAPLRGYVYQIWHTLHAWLELADNEVLFVEGAEDFDIVAPDGANAVQVKDAAKPITLRSSEVVDAIGHYWEMQAAHAGRRVFFRFLTRSKMAVEKGAPFGSDLAGLDVWRMAARDTELIERLRKFLLEEGQLPADVLELLRTASGEELRTKLIIPITWETARPEAAVVEEAIRRKLILRGDKTGIPPSKSSAVVSRLLKEVLQVATRKDDRSLERALFFEIFEQETTERVPHHELAAMRRAVGLSTSTLPAGAGGVPEFSFQLSVSYERGIPPSALDVARRRELVVRLTGILQRHGMLALTGSTGTGKTTVAKLVAQTSGGAWIWVNLTGKDAAQCGFILLQLGKLLEQEAGLCRVILDDFALTPSAARQVEDYLGGLVYTIIQRNGSLILTSQRDVPQRLSSHVGVTSECSQKVPGFAEDELFEFALQLGCPTEEDARLWARITLIHTSGHPQLVHAHFRNLARNRWPAPSSTDILHRPDEVRRALAEARSLVQGLPEEHKELLYRLSIVAGPFRHDQAICIGEIEPKVSFAGDACDSLIGPWVEPAGQEYFRVSPLLKDCAKDVWPRERIVDLLQSTGVAILKCSPRTTIDANTALMHGVISLSPYLFFAVTSSLLHGPPKVLEAIAPSLKWLLAVATKPGVQLFPKEPILNFNLRMIQFRVAAQLYPTTDALRILAAWESDPIPDTTPDLSKSRRMLFLTSIIYAIKVPVPPRKLIQAIVELAQLMDRFPELKEQLSKISLPEGEDDPYGLRDPICLAFFVATGRTLTVQVFEEFLDALDQDAPDPIRQRMLAGVKLSSFYATMLVDAVWVEESNRNTPDWEDCIRVLEKCLAFGQRHGITELALASARGIAVVRDEYLDDKTAAITILDRFVPNEGLPSVVIENAKASVLLHSGKYSEALACWARILPLWPHPTTKGDTGVLFAFSKAGLAAGRAGQWDKAAAFFIEGATRANTLAQEVFAVGFRVDAAWALWRASKYREAFELLKSALPAVESLPDPLTTPFAFKVEKSFGHTLLCIKREIEREDYEGLAQPPPGMASDPGNAEEWYKLPRTPKDLCLLFLAEIEDYLGCETVLLQHTRSRLAHAQAPLVRMLLAEFEVRHAFRHRDFDHTPKLCNQLGKCFAASKANRDRENIDPSIGQGGLDVVASREYGEAFTRSLLIYALLAAINMGLSSTVLLQRWREDARNIADCAWLLGWLAEAERLFTAPVGDALAVMQSKCQVAESRTPDIALRIS